MRVDWFKHILLLIKSNTSKWVGPQVLTTLVTALPMRLIIAGQVRRLNMDIFFIFFNMKVCCVFEAILMSTQYTIFNILKIITVNYPKSAAVDFS